jgi:hypothetical protein
LKYLIIQYSGNDSEENSDFYRGQFKIMSEEQYRNLQMSYELDGHSSYFPFKYLIHLAKNSWKGLTHRQDSIAEPAINDTDAFLYVLKNGGINLHGIEKIIVFELTNDPTEDSFTHRLKKRIQNEVSPWREKLIVLDASEFIKLEDFYTLDDHLRPRGHERLTEALAKQIEQVSAKGSF